MVKGTTFFAGLLVGAVAIGVLHGRATVVQSAQAAPTVQVVPATIRTVVQEMPSTLPLVWPSELKVEKTKGKRHHSVKRSHHVKTTVCGCQLLVVLAR